MILSLSSCSKRMYNNPTAYGLQNTASSCVVGNTTCDDRDQYLWYDCK